MPAKVTVNDVSGYCPICDNEDLKYGTFDLTRQSFPFECPSCGAEGYEHYSLDYLETSVDKWDKSYNRKLKKEGRFI